VQLTVIASPYYFGHERVGMARGVDAILAAGFLAAATGQDAAAVHWVGPQRAFRDEIGATFDLCSSIADAVARAVERGQTPVVLAGNCMATLGVLAGLRPKAGPTGVVWLDAHADLHTAESTTSGYLDGMALAAVTGRCWAGVAGTVDGFAPTQDEHVVLVGARDLDEPERELLAAGGVRHLGATGDLDDDGQRRSLDDALAALGERVGGVHLHIDADVLDPDLVAPANEFAAPGGLTATGLVEVVRRVADRVPVRSVTLASYDPAEDPDGRVAGAAVGVAHALRGAG